MSDLPFIEYLMQRPAGFTVKDKAGTPWIKMEDSIQNHLEGYFLNSLTGKWIHASRMPDLIRADDGPSLRRNGPS